MIADLKPATDPVVSDTNKEEDELTRYLAWREKNNRKLHFDYSRRR
jgi:hypothetical protein